MTNHLKWIASSMFLCLGTLITSAVTNPPVDLQVHLDVPFHFVAYGDTRFTDPHDTKASNAAVRRALVRAIDAEHPAFISVTGDISFKGDQDNDWKVWDEETAIWRQHKIAVYPTLGNHDLTGNLQLALANYSARFPDLKGSRYYSVSAGNTLMLVLDSSLDELTGAQGQWLKDKLDHLPPTAEFVFFVLHHPPYTSLSSLNFLLSSHAARPSEMALAKVLEACQQHTHARLVVFSGHVHNYERHEHNGVTYFVTGGGGASAYPIPRAAGDAYQDHRINYHYLLVEVDHGRLQVTMKRMEFSGGTPTFTEPDSVTITTSAAAVPATP